MTQVGYMESMSTVRHVDDQDVTLARDEGIQTLYRYMPYPTLIDLTVNAIERRRRVNDLIAFGEIYLPVASQFNDPFEASPHFRIPRREDGSIDAEIYVFHLRNRYGPQWGWSEQRIAQAEADLRQKIETGTFESETAINESNWRERLRNEFPMCCLTDDRANIPMWSYYADSHTGVCVHLDATIPPFGVAFKVSYSDEYPFLPQPVAGLAPRLVIRKCLLVKAMAWAHENEYRLIDMPGSDGAARTLDPPISFSRNGRLITFHKRHVVGLTCGASMKDDAIEALARFCADRRPRLPIWQAKLAKNKFELSQVEIRG